LLVWSAYGKWFDVAAAGLTEHLARVLAEENPWPRALACLAQGVGAEVAIVLEGGGQPKRLGSYGPLPTTLSQVSDEAMLVAGLERLGMQSIWSRAFRRDPGTVYLLALAGRKADTISAEDDAILEAASALIDLRLQTVASHGAVEREQNVRKVMEARLVEIERQSTVGTVASAVAHDLAAPISALLMEISELRERVGYLTGFLPDNNVIVRNILEDIRGLVEHCNESSERARQLLTDFRLAAHPGGTTSVPSAAANIGEAIRACVRLVRPLAREKARLEITIAPDLPIIAGNHKRIEQALTNLLTNAIQAASVREGFAGLVEVRARREGADIIIEVQDNGVGMAPEIKADIFKPFFTTKTAEHGTGLGLPIAKDAVESHGGTIVCESEPGRGATFRIQLPITAVPAHAAPTHVRRRVLVVDDDDGVARALERILRADYDVSVARSGEHALELIATMGPFDAMLVDLAMPVMDGPHLYERIRHMWPGMEKKIIFATGGAFTAASRAFLASVPNSRFEKPITREELRPIVQSVVVA
jgi:two-component system, cell cycle sensor histidine kinase and response regulator CckA